MRRIGLVFVASIGVLVLGICAPPATALGPGDLQPPPSNDRSVSVDEGGHDGGASAGGAAVGATSGRSNGAGPICVTETGRSVDVAVGPMQYKPATHENMLWPYPNDDHHLWQITHCLYPDGHRTNTIALIDTTPAPGTPTIPVTLTADQLALRATAQLHFEFPELHLSPPGTNQSVGFPIWIWIDPTNWTPRTATDTDGTLTVTLTATPTTITFDPGDTSPAVTCNGPGTPYPTQGTPNAWKPSPTCGHTYTTPTTRHPGGTTNTTTTLTWTFTWTANNGTTGTLADLDLTHHQALAITAYTATTN